MQFHNPLMINCWRILGWIHYWGSLRNISVCSVYYYVSVPSVVTDAPVYWLLIDIGRDSLIPVAGHNLFWLINFAQASVCRPAPGCSSERRWSDECIWCFSSCTTTRTYHKQKLASGSFCPPTGTTSPDRVELTVAQAQSFFRQEISLEGKQHIYMCKHWLLTRLLS